MKDILAKVNASYDFRVLEVARIFCPEGHCLAEHGGVPLYCDDDHEQARSAVCDTANCRSAVSHLLHSLTDRAAYA